MSKSTKSEPTKPQAPILIFDIETVPDIELLRDSYPPKIDFEINEATVWRDLRISSAIATQRNQSFPRPIFHRVVSICALFIHPETYHIMDGFRKSVPLAANNTEFCAGEAQLLKDFWNFTIKYEHLQRTWYDRMQSEQILSYYEKRKFKSIPVTLCGYNITGFDLPVIEQRSLKYLLACPMTEYARETGFDSYRYKYAQDKVFDLCHYVANYQDNTRIGLDILSRAMGLGGKMEGMDGSKVAENYFDKGAWEKIEEYCAIDVLITFGVLLGVQKFRGVISEEEFNAAVLEFEQFLLKPGKPESYRALAETSTAFFAHGHL